MFTNNPKIVTTSIADCWDAKQPSTVPSVSVIADQIAALNSKDYTTYSSGGKTHYVWTFLSTETFNTKEWPLFVDAFVVGGGGAGKAAGYNNHNGGGGAGGVVYATGFLLPAGIHTFTVGGGGGEGQKGGDSSIITCEFGGDTLVGNGGGCTGLHGGGGTNDWGGSGGGAYVYSDGGDETQSSENGVLSSGGVTNFGNDGGHHTGTTGGQYGAAGGGGAGAAGHDGTNVVVGDNGDGGVGIQEGVDFYINGTSNWYAGGGGGTCATCAVGGTGGGGNGGNWGSCNGQSGTANTGGGGGGHDNRGSGTQNYAGGSGIIIIRLTDDPGSIQKSFLSDQAMGGGTAEMYNGAALDFDGTNDYVNIASTTADAYGVQDSHSFAIWVKARTAEAACIMSMDDDTGWHWNTVLYTTATGIVGYHNAMSGATDAGSITKTMTYVGTWHHVVLTVTFPTTTSRTMAFYVDGALVNTASSAVSAAASAYLVDEGNIGRYHIGVTGSDPLQPPLTGQGSWFDGAMADARVYDVALSAASVKELYDDSKVIIPTKNDATGSSVDQTNLKCWWPMVDGTGTIAFDGSGSSHDGTLVNMASDDWLTGQTGCPQLVTGYNMPVVFTKSRAVHADWTNTQSLDDITLSAWVYPTIHNSYNPIIRLGGAFFLLNGSGTSLRLVDGWATSPGYQSYTFNLNQWYHVAATRVRSGNQILYVNGSQIKSEGAQSSSISMSLVEIGRRSTDYFDGLINEVVVYDGALAAGEIAKLAARDPNGGPLPPDAVTGVTGYNSVLGYYRNDGTPSLAGTATWIDRSGNGNIATVYGSPYDLLFKQGYNDSASTSTGRDNQGFPLKQKDVGAMGIHLRGVPGAGSATDPGNTAATGVPARSIVTSGNAYSGNAFTVSAWVNPTSLGTGYARVIVNKRTQNGHWPSIGLHVGSTGTLVAQYSSATYGQCLETYTTATGLIEQDKWYHVVFVKPAGTPSINYLEVKLYINGVNTAWTNSLYGNHLYSNTVATSTQPLYIGRALDGDNLTGTWVSTFVGQIGPIHLYSRGLTAEEVTQNYNAQRSRFNV